MKKIFCFAISILICAILASCSAKQTDDESKNRSSMFVKVESVLSSYEIVYHKDTNVMYAVSEGIYNTGTFTVLVNPDGTPMILED